MRRSLLKFCAASLLLVFSFSLFADENENLYELARQLDSIERNFWRIASRPREYRQRPEFLSLLHKFETLARQVRTSCISCSDGRVPDIHNCALTISRCYDQFSLKTKYKLRNLALSGTGLKDYQRRHNKLMREKALEEEAESGVKKKRNSAGYKLRPKLSQIDRHDYNDFLDETSDKNKRKFYSWIDGVKSREQSVAAQQIFDVWLKAVCDMRANLVKMAQTCKFKEEKKR